MRRKFTLIVLLTFVSFSFLCAQTAVIKGKILDDESGKSLENASISIMGTQKGTVSDKNGEFVLSKLKAGEYKLLVKYTGYLPKEFSFNLDDGEAKTVNINMEVDVKKLLEVEIIDDKIENSPYSKTLIKKDEIETNNVKDVGEFLRMVPNVHSVRKGGVNMDPVIRGFKFSQLNIIADNAISIEGGCPNRMDPTTAHIESGDIEAIEVFKGPHALRFGPNFGGVVNMHTINPRPFNEFQIRAKGSVGYESNWNGKKQHLTVLGGGQKVFFALTGNYHNYGNYEDGEGNLVRSRFEKMGYSAKLGFSPAKDHIIYASFSQFDARNVAFSALPMDERTDNTKIYSLDYKAKNISKTVSSLNFKAYYTDVAHVMDNYERSFGDTVAAIAAIDAQRMGYRAEAGLEVGEGHLFVGTDFYNIFKDGSRTKNMIMQPPTPLGSFPVKVEKLWNNAEIQNIGAFAEYNKLFGAIELVAAARIDLNSASSDSIHLTNMMGMPIIDINAENTESSFTNFSFSVGGTYSLTEKLSASLSLGSGTRSPDMLERFIIALPVGYDNYEYMGNPQLEPETNNEVDLSFKYIDERIGGFEFTTFYSLVNNYISGVYVPKTEQKPLTNTVLGVKRFENVGDANLYGFEFGYTSPMDKKWGLKISAAYTQGNLAEGKMYFFDNAGNATGDTIIKNDPLSEIPPLDFKLAFNYKLFNSKFIPELQLRYVADQNRVSEIHQEPTSKGFYLANFRLTYNHNKTLSVIAGVNNILDNAYYEHLNRRVLGTNSRIYEPGRVLFVNLVFNI
jgi:iron complex outermembrane receptor protein